MKTSKEFYERLQNDEAFAKEVGEKVKAKMDAGEEDYKAVWIPLAEEYGYEVTGEELDELVNKTDGELSEEELGKVAGGTTPFVVIGTISLSTAVTVVRITVDTLEDGI